MTLLYADTIKQRFFAKTQRVGACLEWTGAFKKPSKPKNPRVTGTQLPYGRFRLGQRMLGAHVVAFAIAHNVDVESLRGVQIGHECDNPKCVAAEHLKRCDSVSVNLTDQYKRNRREEALNKLRERNNLKSLCAWFEKVGTENVQR